MNDTTKIVNRIIEKILPHYRGISFAFVGSDSVELYFLGRYYFVTRKIDGSFKAILNQPADVIVTDADNHCTNLFNCLLNGGVKRDDAGNLEVVK